MLPRRPVVAAAIFKDLHTTTNAPPRLLAAARSYPPNLAGLFELPGGKVETAENPKDALEREIEEELGIRITITGNLPGTCFPQQPDSPQLDSPNFGAWPILENRCMWVWLAELAPNQAAPTPGNSHLEFVWAEAEEALQLPWIPSNQPIVAKLVESVMRR